MKKCIEDVTSLQLRLKKVAGQLNGIQKMLAEDVPCEDIMIQINAIKSAVQSVGQIILEGHLDHCVREGIIHGDADKTIAEFTEVIKQFSKL